MEEIQKEEDRMYEMACKAYGQETIGKELAKRHHQERMTDLREGPSPTS
jgi:hypothetical protein